MNIKRFFSATVAIVILLPLGMWVKDAGADAILFPWVVRSADVTTVVSVVNTAETDAEALGFPVHNNRIHIEYFHKMTTANDQEEKCSAYNFETTSSKDDMVTWDIAGHFHGGLPMFNDTNNDMAGVPDMTLAVDDPRRAFLIVDNNTDALMDSNTNVDGTMYGEAIIIEHKTGAAWGYIAYNGTFGSEDSNFSDEDKRDQQGEVIGVRETTQMTLINPNDAHTKLFVTPTARGTSSQRQGNLNVRIYLCRSPERNTGSGIDGDPYTGECNSGGIWNNEEGGFSFTTKKNIVCTIGDDIGDFFGGAGTSAYKQWTSSGKAGWAYVMTAQGNVDNRDDTNQFEETDEAIIGKLEYGTGIFWDGSIADTINTFVWLRDNSSLMAFCQDDTVDDERCDPMGINIIHNESAGGFF